MVLRQRNAETIKFCPDDIFETKDCSVDCVLGWGDWTSCDESGKQNKPQSIVIQKKGLGMGMFNS